MSEQSVSGAVILPFPARPLSASERLQRALAGLDGALQQQRAAVGELQVALTSLRDTMGGLNGSMTSFCGNLDGLAGQVAGLHHTACQLERLCDDTLATAAAQAEP